MYSSSICNRRDRAKELSKLENRVEFLQDRLLELATRTDVQDALIKIKSK